MVNYHNHRVGQWLGLGYEVVALVCLCASGKVVVVPV